MNRKICQLMLFCILQGLLTSAVSDELIGNSFKSYYARFTPRLLEQLTNYTNDQLQVKDARLLLSDINNTFSLSATSAYAGTEMQQCYFWLPFHYLTLAIEGGVSIEDTVFVINTVKNKKTIPFGTYCMPAYFNDNVVNPENKKD